MDRPHHPDSRARDDAVRRATARDRRHFAKNAYPNLAHPRARRPGATQSASGRAAESGILAYKAGADLDRAAARALPVVGKTFGRTSGKSRPGKGANRSRDCRPRLIDIVAKAGVNDLGYNNCRSDMHQAEIIVLLFAAASVGQGSGDPVTPEKEIKIVGQPGEEIEQ